MPKLFEQRFVAFIDVLGFRGLVARMTAEPELFRTVRDSLKEVQKQAKIFSRYRAALNARKPGLVLLPRKSDLQMTAFSDCFVISETFPAWHVLAAVQALGSLYLQRGILTRGGIVYGPMYQRGTVVFGPAIIEAYELESRAAVYPRILVSKQVREECWGYHRGLCKEQLFVQDADGAWFVNVLAPPLSSWDALTTTSAEKKEMTKFLRRTRDVIARLAAGAKHDEAHRSKVGWLLNQFNIAAAANGVESLKVI